MKIQAVTVEVQHTIRYGLNDQLDGYRHQGPGQLVTLSSYQRLTYTDSQGQETVVKWPQEAGSLAPLEIRRPQGSLVFHPDQVTETYYQTPEGAWPLQLETLACQLDSDLQQVQVRYRLYQGGQVLGDYDFQLIYRQ